MPVTSTMYILILIGGMLQMMTYLYQMPSVLEIKMKTQPLHVRCNVLLPLYPFIVVIIYQKERFAATCCHVINTTKVSF